MTRQMVTEAVRELYNPAQIDVFDRASLLARERLNTVEEAQPVAAPVT